MIATAMQIDEISEAFQTALDADRTSLMLVIIGVAVVLGGLYMIQNLWKERKEADLRESQAKRENDLREAQSKRDEAMLGNIMSLVKDQASQNEKLTSLINEQKDQREKDANAWRNELNATSEAMVTVAESVTELTRAIRDLRGENQRHNDDTKATLDKLSAGISQVKISIEDITRAINEHKNDTTTIQQLNRVESVVSQLVNNVQKFIERVDKNEANREESRAVIASVAHDAIARDGDAGSILNAGTTGSGSNGGGGGVGAGDTAHP